MTPDRRYRSAFAFTPRDPTGPQPEPPMTTPIHERIHAEMLDSFDEELELEIDDDRLDALTNEFADHTATETVDRRVYFQELFRLQGELVKLQDWVQHQKLKVVVIFEGRDSAGKGGVIKRITQRLNPARLPRRGAAGAERARAHAMVFPALRAASAGRRRDRAVRPQLVQPRRRRAGDGLLHRRGQSRSSSARAGVRAHAGALRHHAGQVLVLDHRRGAAAALH